MIPRAAKASPPQIVLFLSTYFGFLLLWSLHIHEIHALVVASPNSHVSNGNGEERLRLVTWNVLAPTFCHPQKYFWTSPEHLSWKYREKIIHSELERMDADIICLQEMETEFFDDFMEPLQEKYEGVLQNVTNGHPISNAILIRKGKLRVLRQESRSRALILVIDRQERTDNQSLNRPLYLATVHLQAGMEDDETRVFQLKSLLKRIYNHVQIENPEPSKKKSSDIMQKATVIKDPPPPPIILAGDFNMLPTNPVYRFLSHIQHNNGDTMQQPPRVSLTDSGTGLELVDLKFPKNVRLLPLKDILGDMSPIMLQGGDDEQQRHDNGPDARRLQQAVQMTYCGGSVLDYIWTTRNAAATTTTTESSSDRQPPSIKVHQTVVFHPAAFARKRQRWPSKEHPSDHLPLGMDFSWR